MVRTHPAPRTDAPAWRAQRPRAKNTLKITEGLKQISVNVRKRGLAEGTGDSPSPATHAPEQQRPRGKKGRGGKATG